MIDIQSFSQIVSMFESISDRLMVTFSTHKEGFVVVIKFRDDDAEELESWLSDVELSQILYNLSQIGFRTIIRASVNNSLILNILDVREDDTMEADTDNVEEADDSQIDAYDEYNMYG